MAPLTSVTSAHLSGTSNMCFCLCVFFLVNTFPALRRQDFKRDLCHKLYLCLSLVLLTADLDTHLPLAVNVTPTQPAAPRPKWGPDRSLPPGPNVRWTQRSWREAPWDPG